MLRASGAVGLALLITHQPITVLFVLVNLKLFTNSSSCSYRLSRPNWKLVTENWLLVIGNWLLEIGYWKLVTRNW